MPVYKHNKPTADGRIWRFQVSYKDDDGKYKSYKSGLYATKKEAENEQAKWRLEHKGSAGNLLTFDEVIPAFLQDKKATVKPQTYDREKVLCGHVSRLIGGVVISKMTAVQYERFRQRVLESDWSVSYKNKVNKQLKSILEYADRKYDIRNTIPKKYKAFTDPAPKKEMQIYTLDEFYQFLECVENPVLADYFFFLMFTGARLNEANALQWTDIDFNKGTASINKTIVQKTHTKEGLFEITSPKTPASIRSIPLAEKVLNRLKMRKNEQMALEGFSSSWFCFGGSRPLAETTINKAKDKAIEKSGLHYIRIHDLRHSYTSMLVNNLGVDNIMLVSRLLGHGSVQETLRTYSHLWNSSLNDYVTLINSL